MKKSLLAIALFAIIGAAFATPNDTATSCPGNSCKGGNATSSATGGTGVGVGVGVGIAQGGKSSANAKSNQAQKQAQKQKQSMDGSGNSTLSGSNNTENNISGDKIVYERQAPAIFNAATEQPIRSCRLTIFGGISRTDGSMSGGIPIGNDQTCLTGAQLDYMDIAGGFSKEDKQYVACQVEGMDKTKTCKALFKKLAREQGYEGDDEYVINRITR